MAYKNYSTATPYIVDKNGHGDFTTITAAMAVAGVAGGTVFVTNGTYTESFTLPPNVSLAAYASIPMVFGPPAGAIIDGTVTFMGNGQAAISGISLSNSGAGAALSISGSTSGLLIIQNCVFSGGSVAAISSSNANASLIGFNLIIIAPTSDIINNTGGSIMFSGSMLPNVGGTPNIIVNGATAGCEFDGCSIGGPVVVSNGASVKFSNCQAKDISLSDASSLNGTYTNFDVVNSNFAIGGTSSVNLTQCVVDGNTPVITIAVGANLSIDQGRVNANGAGFAIAGTGYLSYGILELPNSGTNIDPGLSIGEITVRPFPTAASSNATAIRGLASFDSASFSVDSTGWVQLGAAVPLTFDGDTGTATASSNILTIDAGVSTLNCGSTVLFNAGGSTVELKVTDVSNNTIIGLNSGSNSPGSGNVSVGEGNLSAHPTTNTAMVAIGNGCLAAASACQDDIAIGSQSLASLTAGQSNIAIGSMAGSAYTTTESSNILINNIGVLAESNVMRIGTQGGGLGQQDQCFIAGITGATPTSANTPQVTLCDNTGNLAVISSSTAGFVLTSNGTATPSFQAASSSSFPWTDEAVSFNPLATNGYFITAVATATLPAVPSQGNMISFAVDTSQILTIQANTGQIIRIGAAVSASAGTAVNTVQGDSVTLVYRSSDSAWIATSVIGTWTVT